MKKVDLKQRMMGEERQGCCRPPWPALLRGKRGPWQQRKAQCDHFSSLPCGGRLRVATASRGAPCLSSLAETLKKKKTRIGVLDGWTPHCGRRPRQWCRRWARLGRPARACIPAARWGGASAAEHGDGQSGALAASAAGDPLWRGGSDCRRPAATPSAVVAPPRRARYRRRWYPWGQARRPRAGAGGGEGGGLRG